MTQSATQEPSVETLIQDIESYIEDAVEITERGEYVELKGLDARVEHICSSIAAMPSDAAKDYAETMEALMKKLELLQQLFASKRDSLGEEIEDSTKHQMAAKAYKKSEVPVDDDAETS